MVSAAFKEADWNIYLQLNEVEEEFLANDFPLELEICNFIDDDPSDVDPDYHEIEWVLPHPQGEEPGVFLGFVATEEFRRAFADIEPEPEEYCSRRVTLTIAKRDDVADRKSHENWGCWLEISRIEFHGWVTDEELGEGSIDIFDKATYQRMDPDLEPASPAGDRDTRLRKTHFTLYNNINFELYARWIGDEGSEFWLVSEIDGERRVENHEALLTQTYVDQGIYYAVPGDLVWVDADESEFPASKSEQTIEHEKFMEPVPDHFRYLETAGMLFSDEMKVQRKVWNQAKKDLYGKWADGVASIEIRDDDSVVIDCPDIPDHVLHPYQYWKNANCLSFCNNWAMGLAGDTEGGLSMGIIRCDREQLHVFVDDPRQIAHVFHRTE